MDPSSSCRPWQARFPRVSGAQEEVLLSSWDYRPDYSPTHPPGEATRELAVQRIIACWAAWTGRLSASGEEERENGDCPLAKSIWSRRTRESERLVQTKNPVNRYRRNDATVIHLTKKGTEGKVEFRASPPFWCPANRQILAAVSACLLSGIPYRR
jgi:hypothetical protein